jgi:hypothetical protein
MITNEAQISYEGQEPLTRSAMIITNGSVIYLPLAFR